MRVIKKMGILLVVLWVLLNFKFSDSSAEVLFGENPMPYFNFSISFGVRSRNSQSFASIVKSILVTLFLQ